jgi:hypothetical protein
MDAQAIKDVAEGRPFRPFIIRLRNGAEYTFSEAKNFGAPEDFREVFCLGKSDWVLIDLENIVEVSRK